MKKILRAIKYSVAFPMRVLRVSLALKNIDHSAPFTGPLASNGIYKSRISSSSIKELDYLFSARKTNAKFDICLKKVHEDTLKEIFNKLEPIVRSYLGKESYLDGINWLVTEPNEESVSGNWHTDNVGNRLKCFVCVRGDGNTPTLIIPSEERIPRLTTVFRNTIVELLRWIGLKAEFRFKAQFLAEHRTGSLYLFDTQLFHRGGYSSGQVERIIFHMEFSDRRKHSLITGPIGTFKSNSFCFDSDLANNNSFARLLDNKRIVDLGDGVFAYHAK